ncbi:uncharacterized protein [Nicotiana tomentosiformis]|uniref:uncharacterized protein n=1 Tax=Nicotiana tomentosiformis TaxID=4098 RepID=UPI00388CDA1C
MHDRGIAQQVSHDVTSAPVVTPPCPPSTGEAQAVRGFPRGAGQLGGGQTHCYAFLGRPEAEAFDIVIEGIVTVYHRYALVLFDHGSTYSYVSSYFISHLDFPCSSLNIPVYVYTTVGVSIMVDRMYRSCVVTIDDDEISVDHLLLNMVDFDVILAIDWFSPYHAILDCHAKIVMLAMPGFPKLE